MIKNLFIALLLIPSFCFADTLGFQEIGSFRATGNINKPFLSYQQLFTYISNDEQVTPIPSAVLSINNTINAQMQWTENAGNCLRVASLKHIASPDNYALDMSIDDSADGSGDYGSYAKWKFVTLGTSTLDGMSEVIYPYVNNLQYATNIDLSFYYQANLENGATPGPSVIRSAFVCINDAATNNESVASAKGMVFGYCNKIVQGKYLSCVTRNSGSTVWYPQTETVAYPLSDELVLVRIVLHGNTANIYINGSLNWSYSLDEPLSTWDVPVIYFMTLTQKSGGDYVGEYVYATYDNISLEVEY